MRKTLKRRCKVRKTRKSRKSLKRTCRRKRLCVREGGGIKRVKKIYGKKIGGRGKFVMKYYYDDSFGIIKAINIYKTLDTNSNEYYYFIIPESKEKIVKWSLKEIDDTVSEMYNICKTKKLIESEEGYKIYEIYDIEKTKPPSPPIYQYIKITKDGTDDRTFFDMNKLKEHIMNEKQSSSTPSQPKQHALTESEGKQLLTNQGKRVVKLSDQVEESPTSPTSSTTMKKHEAFSTPPPPGLTPEEAKQTLLNSGWKYDDVDGWEHDAFDYIRSVQNEYRKIPNNANGVINWLKQDKIQDKIIKLKSKPTVKAFIEKHKKFKIFPNEDR